MRNLEPISPTHPANPITPLMMEAQEEPQAATPAGETASAAPAPADEAAAEPHPAPKSAPVHRAERGAMPAPAFTRCQVGSLMLLLLGAALGVAPTLSPKVAEFLEAAGSLHNQAGTLIVAGLLLYTVTVVWRALWGIRGSLEAVGSETARIEQIAMDGQTLRESLDTVKYANSTLSGDVNNLQVQVKRLTDIVSNPDYTVSIFRLAASVDQLGKHIELHLKAQFEGLQKQTGALADQAGHVQSQIAARLEQVQALAKDQHRSQYSAVQDGIALLLAASEETNTRIERNLDTGTRIEARLQDQQESLSTGIDSVLDRIAQGAGQFSSTVAELGGRVDRQLEGHSAAVHAKLSGIDARLEAGQREHASGIQELGERLGGSLGSHVEDLKQKLRAVAEISNGNRQELDNHLDVLGARIDGHAGNLTAGLERVREHALENARTIQRDVGTGLAHLEAQLAESAREHAAVLRKASHEAQQASGTTRRELNARLEQLGLDLERQARDQQAALTKAAQESQQSSTAARRELAGRLETLGTELERRSRDHLEALNRTAQESQATTGALRDELVGSLDHLASRLEEKLESRTSGIATDLIELAEMLDAILIELRRDPVAAIEEPQPLEPEPLETIAPSAPEASYEPLVTFTPDATPENGGDLQIEAFDWTREQEEQRRSRDDEREGWSREEEQQGW